MEKVDLKFSCNEDFSKMSSTERGLYCQECKKEVIDYRSASFGQIKAASASKGEVCGLFLAEQIDPSLHPIQIPQRLKSFAFLSSLFLTVGTTSVHGQSAEDPKVEESKGASNAPNLSPGEVNEEMKQGSHISMSVGTPRVDELNAEEPVVENKRKKAKKHRYKRWYRSKRFPFFHRKRRFHGGKFAFALTAMSSFAVELFR